MESTPVNAAATTSEDLSNKLEETGILIGAIISEMTSELEQSEPDAPGHPEQADKQRAALIAAVTRLNKLEADLEAARTKLSGHRNFDDIDLDAVRSEIRCRLGRIRECCRPR